MKRKILCVDDEANILFAYRRQLKKHFDVDTALGGREGLQAIDSKGPYAVIVSDLRMPEMSGVEFLAKVLEKSPDSIRMMITGFADLDSAMSAVNEGRIFRFLTKPVETGVLVSSLHAALKQYNLVVAEKELLENTLNGAVNVMSEVLSLVNPTAFSRTSRLKKYVSHCVNRLGIQDQWKYELAAMLSHIGCIALHPDTIEKVYSGHELSDDERDAFRSHPKTGCRLLEKIPRMEDVAEMVKLQFNPMPIEGDISDAQVVAVGSQILHSVIEYDMSIVHGGSGQGAIERMKKDPLIYHPDIVATLTDMVISRDEMEVKSLRIGELTADMIIDEDICSLNGLLLMAKGQEITFPALERLRKFAVMNQVKEPILTLVPCLVESEKEKSPGETVKT